MKELRTKSGERSLTRFDVAMTSFSSEKPKIQNFNINMQCKVINLTISNIFSIISGVHGRYF